MDSIEYLQKQLLNPLELSYEFDDDRDEKSKDYDLVCEGLSNYKENRLLFDKVLSSSDFPIVSFSFLHV